ncbi:hypothetical protein MTX36_01605 [Rhodococcus sp. ARC_M6]|nr:hypothetical protein [Rhodococcus sp. ARC_M6]
MSAQIASNGSNFVLTMLIARSVTTAELGIFAILMAVNGLAIGVLRGFSAEPMIFGESSVSSYEGARRHNAVVGSSAVLSVCISMLLLPVVGIATGNWLLALIFCAAGCVMGIQDAIRFILVSTGRSRQAFVLECVWIAVQLPLIWLVYDKKSLDWLVASWTVGALCSAVYGMLCIRWVFSLRDATSWISKSYRIGFVYSSDFLVGGGIAQLVTFLIAAFAGLDAAGEYRAAQMLLMPLSILTLGLTFALSPEVARMAAHSQFRRLKSVPYLYAGAIITCAAAIVGTVSILPGGLLGDLLGESATGAATLLPFVALATCVVSVAVGPGLVLRALGRVRDAFLLKCMLVVPTIGAVVIGCVYLGAIGAQIGLAAVSFVRAVGIWILMNRRMKSQLDSTRGVL